MDPNADFMAEKLSASPDGLCIRKSALENPSQYQEELGKVCCHKKGLMDPNAAVMAEKVSASPDGLCIRKSALENPSQYQEELGKVCCHKKGRAPLFVAPQL